MGIFEYIKQVNKDNDKIAYVTRSYAGSWSISFYKKGNISGHSLQSYSQLSDNDLQEIKDMGIKTFDFKTVSESEFWDLHKEQEKLSAITVY